MTEAIIPCPHCGAGYAATAAAPGQKVACGQCENRFFFDASPVPPAAPPAAGFLVFCPHCGAGYEATAAAPGQKVSCHQCKNKFFFGDSRPPPPALPPAPPPADEALVLCPHCGRGYDRTAAVRGGKVGCGSCGNLFLFGDSSVLPPKPPRKPPPETKKAIAYPGRGTPICTESKKDPSFSTVIAAILFAIGALLLAALAGQYLIAAGLIALAVIIAVVWIAQCDPHVQRELSAGCFLVFISIALLIGIISC